MHNKNKNTIYLLAGEASGDLHGSGLMQAIKKINSSIIFIGIGGPKMEKEGLQTLVPMSRLAVMGFWEVLKKIAFFFKLEKQVLQQIHKTQPSQIIMIDYPGFNLRIAKKIKQKYNIKITYYISPQLWAWKEKRIDTIKKYIDTMIVVFPFEKKWYKKRGLSVEYFGHPVIDHSQAFNYSQRRNNKEINIAICPGSRKQEIKRHMPILSQLIQQYPLTINQKVNFTIIQAPGIKKALLIKYLKSQSATIVNTNVLKI
jgi:lipid-A-disaccharide synthase